MGRIPHSGVAISSHLLVDFIADAGKQMLESSSSVCEILDRLRALVPVIGLDGCQIDATLSSLTVSLWRPGFAVPITAMRVVEIGRPPGNDNF